MPVFYHVKKKFKLDFFFFFVDPNMRYLARKSGFSLIVRDVIISF